jgi:hypothetical protein
MATAPWTITNRSAAGSAATASQAAPAGAGTTKTNTIVRLRSLFATLQGVAAGTDQLVVRDGASGTGTIIWQGDLIVAVNGGAIVQMSDLDLRASLGNALTVEFVNGVSSNRECVSAAGDFIPVGHPMYSV